MGSEAPLCYVWLGTMQKMANAAKCKYRPGIACSRLLAYVSIIIKDIFILAGSPHHKKVVFSGALHKINTKYDKNG